MQSWGGRDEAQSCLILGMRLISFLPFLWLWDFSPGAEPGKDLVLSQFLQLRDVPGPSERDFPHVVLWFPALVWTLKMWILLFWNYFYCLEIMIKNQLFLMLNQFLPGFLIPPGQSQVGPWLRCPGQDRTFGISQIMPASSQC